MWHVCAITLVNFSQFFLSKLPIIFGKGAKGEFSDSILTAETQRTQSWDSKRFSVAFLCALCTFAVFFLGVKWKIPRGKISHVRLLDFPRELKRFKMNVKFALLRDESVRKWEDKKLHFVLLFFIITFL